MFPGQKLTAPHPRKRRCLGRCWVFPQFPCCAVAPRSIPQSGMGAQCSVHGTQLCSHIRCRGLASPAGARHWGLIPGPGYSLGCWSLSLSLQEAIQLDGQILFSLLHKVSPVAYKHLSKQKIDPILYMTEWFMCAFSRTLPWSSVLRVWDMFFCEGRSSLPSSSCSRGDCTPHGHGTCSRAGLGQPHAWGGDGLFSWELGGMCIPNSPSCMS